MIHTLNCQKLQLALAAFNATHPDACTRCDGAGYIHYPSSRDDPGGDEECSCLEAGNCPICGQHIFSETDLEKSTLVCSACGWNSAHPLMRPDPDCYCYEQEANAHLEQAYEDRFEINLD